MIIQISKNRRLRSYSYGWMIEKQITRKEGKNVGETLWVEDRPAYPATLGAALEMCLEREMTDSGDADIGELPERIKAALRALSFAMEQARKAA